MSVMESKAQKDQRDQSSQYTQANIENRFYSLVDVLIDHARVRGFETAYVHWSPNKEIQPQISFLQLHQRAQVVASVLQQQLPVGSRVILAFPTGIDFIVSIIGCFYAGMIAVPVYPPFAKKEWPRFTKITQDCGAALICTLSERISHMKEGCSQDTYMKHIPCLAVDELSSDINNTWTKPIIQSHNLALLQYTSGTTGAPKGVMVTHGNIIANLAMIADTFQHTTASVHAGWLPMYHDMGLIGTVLNPLYVGYKAVLIEPVVFLRHPYRWLQVDRKSTRLNSSHTDISRMPSSA